MKNSRGEPTSIETRTFLLVNRNPCTDSNNLSVVTAVEMPASYSYKLFDLEEAGGLEVTSLSLLQVEPRVCMVGLEYMVTFDGY